MASKCRYLLTVAKCQAADQILFVAHDFCPQESHSVLHFIPPLSCGSSNYDDTRNGLICKITGIMEVKEMSFKADNRLVKVSSNATINRAARTWEATKG